MYTPDPRIAQSKLESMLAGNREILNDELLDVECLSARNDIATCFNRQRCGILDQYVGWIGNENKPKDLEFRSDMTAVGSK